jgi:hypothetical protein
LKHAGASTLDQLEALLSEVRALGGSVERSRGVFYRKGRAFLHFHEDPSGLFADLRGADDQDFARYDVSDEEGRSALLAAAKVRL